MVLEPQVFIQASGPTRPPVSCSSAAFTLRRWAGPSRIHRVPCYKNIIKEPKPFSNYEDPYTCSDKELGFRRCRVCFGAMGNLAPK